MISVTLNGRPLNRLLPYSATTTPPSRDCPVCYVVLLLIVVVVYQIISATFYPISGHLRSLLGHGGGMAGMRDET